MSNTTTFHAAAPAPLLPVQQTALDALHRNVAAQRVAVLGARPGAGKTTVLRALHARLGGAFVTTRDFIEESNNGRHPLALEETVYHVLREALLTHNVVIVDDFPIFGMLSCCSHFYPRQNFLAAALVPLALMAQQEGKTLVLSSEGVPLPGLGERVPTSFIGQFAVDDYRVLATTYLGARRGRTGSTSRRCIASRPT